MMVEAVPTEPNFLTTLDEFRHDFDILFRSVAPTKKYNDNRIENFALKLESLSDRQCQEIKNLSGKLTKLIDETSSYRNRTPEYRALDAVPNPWNKYSVEEPEKSRESLLQTIALQRDYLVLELCRSEDLQKQLKEREDFIVSITAEKDALAKKLLAHKEALTAQEAERLRSQVESSTKAKVEDEPESLLNSFVRKEFNGLHFFGVIARYKEPYFKVVYEDADSEDLSKQELIAVLWNRFVPTVKVNACMKHMKDVLAEEMDEEEEEGEESEDGTDSDTGTGTSTENTSASCSPAEEKSHVNKSSNTSGSGAKAVTSSVPVVNIIASDSVAGSLKMEAVDLPAAPSVAVGTVHASTAPPTAASKSSPSGSVASGSTVSRVTPPPPPTIVTKVNAATFAALKKSNEANTRFIVPSAAGAATTQKNDSSRGVVKPSVLSPIRGPQRESSVSTLVDQQLDVRKLAAAFNQVRKSATPSVASNSSSRSKEVKKEEETTSSVSNSSSSSSSGSIPVDTAVKASGSAVMFAPAGSLKDKLKRKNESEPINSKSWFNTSAKGSSSATSNTSSSGSSSESPSKVVKVGRGDVKTAAASVVGSHNNPICLD